MKLLALLVIAIMPVIISIQHQEKHKKDIIRIMFSFMAGGDNA
jgi:hypothetical protein